MYEDLLPDVLANCVGVDEGFALRTLRNVGIDFCIRSLVWEADIDLDTTADQQDYTLTPAYDAVVHEIVSVKVKTASTQSFDDLSPISESLYELQDDMTLHFLRDDYSPQNTITAGMRVRAVLRPTRNSGELPDHFTERWADELVAGATSKLMMIPERPYSNPNTAQHYDNIFRNGIIRASIEKDKLGRAHVEGFSA